MMKTARHFLSGVIAGIILFLVAFLWFYPLYSDYGAAAQTGWWFLTAERVQVDIEQKAFGNPDFSKLDEELYKKEFRALGVDFFKITETGMIILRGGRDGQVTVLIPSFSGESVSWRCVGGSARSVSGNCKHGYRKPVLSAYGPEP
jgi:hypothetical protein